MLASDSAARIELNANWYCIREPKRIEEIHRESNVLGTTIKIIASGSTGRSA